MKIDIKVPSMGESISEVTIGSILTPTGKVIKADQEILELETDKVNQLLYAPSAGLITIHVKTGDQVRVGQSIGTVDTEQSQTSQSDVKIEQKQKETQQASIKTETEQGLKEDLPPIPPKQKSEQKEKQVNLEQELKKEEPPVLLRETKEQWINELKNSPKTEDAENKHVAKAILSSKEKRETRRPMSKVRKVIANRLVEVQQQTAMLTTFNEVDMTKINELREQYKERFLKQYGVKLGFMSFFVKACLSALKAYPDLNSYIEKDEIVHREYYDIGIAVGTDKGLIVPVVRNCDQLSFADIELAIDSLAKKARENKILLEDLQGGGFTITNGGVYGSLLSTPILNPPQSGILGMHKIMKRPIALDDQVVIRPMMYLALSYDHRLIDGKEAVSFLVHVKDRLEDPSRLLLDI